MSEESTFAGRQYSLIVERIARYQDGRLDFPGLVNDLDALWNVLSDAPEDWRKAVRGNWWTLEQLLAVGRDRGDMEGMLAEYKLTVNETLTEIKKLANEALGHRPTSDSS